MDADAADRLLHQLEALRLPRARWTHEAHLVVCWAVLQRDDPDAAVARLRRSIRAYNDATGTPNTETSGYHETLTVYYVGAVHAADTTIAGVLSHPACRRDAPLGHWSRARLFSVAARRSWVEPDLAPIPWCPLPAPTTP